MLRKGGFVTMLGLLARIDEYKPNRLAVDSLSALERISSVKGFREFVNPQQISASEAERMDELFQVGAK